MEKLIKDGAVAVLISPDFGAGWSTWNEEHEEGLLFDRDIVEAVLDGNKDEAKRIAADKYPGAYLGGAAGLEVVWIEQGTTFTVEEYDGSESIRTIADLSHTA